VELACDIAIVGAGAAGHAAAIFAAEAFHRTSSDRRAMRIMVIESARSVGATILISGGGRCNVTHYEVHPDDFNGYQAWVANCLTRQTLATTQRSHLGITNTQVTSYKPDEFRVTFDLGKSRE